MPTPVEWVEGVVIVVEAAALRLVWSGRYNEGRLMGLREGKQDAKRALANQPFQCPHLWGAWSKPDKAMLDKEKVTVQYHTCEFCGLEEARRVRLV